jgi:hypothetical protein
MVESLRTDSRRQAVPVLATPDAVAEAAIASAEHYCASLVKEEGEAQTLLRQGHPQAHDYFRYGLAQALARSVAQVDDTARAIYLVNWDSPADEIEGESVGPTSPLSLIVWVERSTAALAALFGELDAALTGRYRELVDPAAQALRSLLDLHVVDDRDVERRAGYGALLTSLRQRPLLVWQRQPE